MSNITILDGKPQFGENCERCMACIQWCPKNSINFRNKTQKRKRYTNPNIQITDLFKKKEKRI